MESKKLFKLTTIALLCLFFIVAVFACMQFQNASAENTNVIIDLDTSSKFGAFNDKFAYTAGNSLYIVVNNNVLTLNNAFSGTCLDLVLNDDHALLLVKESNMTILKYYAYTNSEITKDFDKVGSTNNKTITHLKSTEDGEFFLTYIYNDNIELMAKFNENRSISESDYSLTIDRNQLKFSDFLKINNKKYFIINGELYYSASSEPLSTDNTSKITDLTQISYLTCINDIVYANTASGIYSIDTTTNQVQAKVSDMKVPNSKIVGVTYNGNQYILVHNSTSIMQYLVNGLVLEYFNKFDNLEYVHPIDFDIVKVAKINSNAKVYSSPKNLQVKATLAVDDYVLILCKKNDDASSIEYYYIATSNNELGYIKTNVDLTYIDSNSNIETLAIGQFAQGLHQSTTIYKYPYSTAEILDTVTIYDQLVVLNNVADDNEQQVWNYYKVSYVKDGEIITGYVTSTSVSPYCSLKAPVVLKSVKITTKTIGDAINIYTLPNEESPIISALVDGTELDLAEEYNKDSTWTKIVYNDGYAYVRTQDIQQTGLTTIQITVIVISIIVVLATILMIYIILRRKKMGY